ncbi:hypothetical protein BV25DRAFT_443670 [Artomyces pyxidatus]|uniref:Uncharacterized protein n=1 Tax=Artomyces pyxidatus TaxID=48021 RepID=A0ACB8T3P0_9AGAM|nr:hypothetical protein BV25DRAFT_443670 [Artomyces pyxidatus]
MERFSLGMILIEFKRRLRSGRAVRHRVVGKTPLPDGDLFQFCTSIYLLSASQFSPHRTPQLHRSPRHHHPPRQRRKMDQAVSPVPPHAPAPPNERDQLRDAQREAAVLRSQLARTQDDCQTQVRLLEDDLAATRRERDALREQDGGAQTQEHALRTANAELRAEVAQLVGQNKVLKWEKNILGQGKDSARAERDALRAERDALRRELDALRAPWARAGREDTTSSVRALCQPFPSVHAPMHTQTVLAVPTELIAQLKVEPQKRKCEPPTEPAAKRLRPSLSRTADPRRPPLQPRVLTVRPTHRLLLT